MYRNISISGRVTVKQGDTIIFESEPNNILPLGYKFICSMFLCANVANVAMGQKSFNIRFGKGTAANALATTALTTAIAVDPGLKTGSGISGSGTHYETHFVGTWTSGILNASLTGAETLAELGLYMGLANNQTKGWTSATWAQGLFSRMVLGANAFVPNIAQPVTVDWCIGVDFV